MPRGFTPNQTTAIRQKLIDTALTKIQETGVRKTSVENLARAANISTGAFYKFYPSKEDLFFEVYELLESRLKAEFFALLEPIHGADWLAVKRAILTLLTSESMQRLLTLIRKEELDYLIMNMDAERVQKHQETDRVYMEEVLDRLNTCGFEVHIDAGLLITYAQALFLLCYEKDQLFPNADRLMDTFLNAMLADLTGRQMAEA